MGFGVLGGEFLGQLGGNLARRDLGLLGGDLLGRHALLVLGEFGHLLAVLDGIDDDLLDVVQARVAHGGQLDGRQVEVVLDAVLDPHRHQRVQAQFDQRHLPGEVFRLVAHRAADDERQPVVHGLSGIRGPLAQVRGDAGAGSQIVLENGGVIRPGGL